MNWKVLPETVFAASPIVPVMVIHRLEDAVPMAKALYEGGIHVFEITLRTACALDAIKLIAQEMPEALVGAGTVITPAQYDLAVDAGAQFVISPGFSPELLAHGRQSDVALIPGIATPSEVMTAMASGYDHLKFFPAETNGGAAALKAISAPLPDVRFCPTGGINPGNVAQYLQLDCVATVGGTWMLPADAIQNGDWETVTQLTRQAVALTQG
ncbi:bifunctional 4-hydroxy-2-oxoglutarate aldolase/2-dehydro-3-deoxy-phosphogluconate aldolase [Vibrio mangrovi]|uniref:2-dehydro-3-deoxy-phosphogluconate aldolase n=1 Tax=Vibrio mangrovi TaxID=474394 RepID=A0A1Y6IYT6_9VIBR|nr:bifunctional 4-hydroxy-2-oxoglutarate aldolase/2-dehydro-3-deoxy-phosphogluconate aldolase [Vibrio mangrovi]MDW6002480.1 bifunctional 4-hydroxy-2-oxoglutarate aldolase/2-dehydro-3-deoxy-phosphogluconate aldolase [Vibrio mangrovi]SMS01990.1 KHG/KDPG aldolase [Vibrio mangrovi]